ncbi:HAMP domain-containing sensor histidine kinase [Nocardioides aestuarii]|uniref:histidine kinase n=1 Tax=Nocardioides aestuarii TaxID=252231 RepID=A0ABW4TS02_9ACTN
MREARGIGTFAGAPRAMQAHLLLVGAAAVLLPFLLRDVGAPVPIRPELLTVVLLLGVSVVNVEMSRLISRGVAFTQQAHKALSAWAFACALLLPPPWLLVVVPIAYAHTWWRGMRVPVWKWTGSAAYVVLAGLAAGVTAHAVLGTRPDPANWMDGNGGHGLVAIAAGGVAFLAVETVLFHASAWLNHAEDERWLRALLRSPWFYLTEVGMLMIGGLLSAVWTGGGWFVLLFVPIYVLAQRASLHDLVSERNEGLEQANRFKIDLMGMLGHELGNPLTSVMGHAQVGAEALDEGDTEQAARSLAVVDRNAHLMRYVLTDVLTLVASESGELVARPEPYAVQPAVLAAVASLPAAGRPRVEGAGDATVLVQPLHLDQMLANLLGNAVKYAGGADVVRIEAVGPTVTISVTDHGPGIPADLRDRLFERFSRADDARHRPGTGLGLFITRELARANGGEVVHRDARPHGAVFELSLPAAETT